MELLFDLFLWSMAGALAFAPLGGAFGALAQAVAHRREQFPQGTAAQAARRGLVSGALFLAVVGFLTGAVVARVTHSFEQGVAQLVILFAAMLALMLAALLFAGVAHFCVWLGVRGTGLLLMLGIALAFAGIEAWKAGLDRRLIAWSAAGVGLAGLGGVVTVRVRSPHGAGAFNPWADDVTDE
jgi:hypothetical protein